MKRLTILFFLTFVTTKAQVQENFLMERFFMNAFNPAYVGSEGESSDDGLPAKRSLAVITRTTWAGVSKAPRINYIYYSGSPKKNLTFGLSVISNKVYIDTRTQYALDASYKLKLGQGYSLFLGAKVGMASKNSNIDELQRLTQEVNPAITPTAQGSYPIFGVGFLLKYEKLFFSFGTPSFLNPEKFLSDPSFVRNENPIFYSVLGGNVDLGVQSLSFNPYYSIKIIPNATNQTSVGGNLDYKNFFEFGGGYKSIGYAYLMGMVKLKMGIDIGYATDFGAGNTASNNRSGFEIFAKYRF